MRILTEITTTATRFLDWHGAFDEGTVANCAILKFGVTRQPVTVVWVLFTMWFPIGPVRSQVRQDPKDYTADGLGHIEYHSPEPRYEGQNPTDHQCQYLGVPCFYERSALAAERLFNKAVEEPAAVWRELETWLDRVDADRTGQRLIKSCGAHGNTSHSSCGTSAPK